MTGIRFVSVRLRAVVTHVVHLSADEPRVSLRLALENVESGTGMYRGADVHTKLAGPVKKFRAGDVLFGRLRPYLAKVVCPDESGLCVGEFLVLRPAKGRVHPEFLSYWLRAKPVVDRICSWTFGAKMPRTEWRFVGNMCFPLPPFTAQARLVAYLNAATTEIDASVDMAGGQIALLTEQRRAIVRRAVTQGLDTGVELRESGVSYLGDIPEQWEVRRLKRCAQLIMGQSPPGQECGPLPGRPFLQGCAEFGERHPTPELACERPPRGAPRGSILLSVRAPVGRLNRADMEYGIGRGLCAILPHVADLQTDFAYYQLEALREGLLASATGSTYDAVSVGDIGNHAILLPPKTEQARIASYLDRATADFAAAAAGVRREIELLKEYRARLIADVVTGRLDVREAADGLSEPKESGA